MKLYTRTGDDGTTGLFGGDRVTKDDARVEAYGTVDETNAAIGLAAASCDRSSPSEARLHEILSSIQSRLFDIGADLATPVAAPPGGAAADKVIRFAEERIPEMEAWIDEIDGGNAPMTSFVLPGGTELSARLHVARTVARRAERALVTLRRREPIGDHVLVLVNRVSDLLFACARRANGSGARSPRRPTGCAGTAPSSGCWSRRTTTRPLGGRRAGAAAWAP